MFSRMKWTLPSHMPNMAPPGCFDLKPMAAFQPFSLCWQPGPPLFGSFGTPFSPGQVGMLIGAVVANHSPSDKAQLLRYKKPEHQPRTSPIMIVCDVPSVASANRAAQVLRAKTPLVLSGQGQSERMFPGP